MNTECSWISKRTLNMSVKTRHTCRRSISETHIFKVSKVYYTVRFSSDLQHISCREGHHMLTIHSIV